MIRSATSSDFLAAEDADDLVNLGHLLQKHFALTLGQATSDDHSFETAFALAVEHLADHAERLLAGRVDKAAGVDDHQVGRVRIGDQHVAVLGQQAKHPLRVDQVLWAAQAHERVCPLEGAASGRRLLVQGVRSRKGGC